VLTLKITDTFSYLIPTSKRCFKDFPRLERSPNKVKNRELRRQSKIRVKIQKSKIRLKIRKFGQQIEMSK